MASIESEPSAAADVFGDRLDTARRYADFLTTAGVERGLIGPREPERIWSRHLMNCAAPAEVFPPEARVADVGSGAGLPGLVLALARPDLSLVLVEPLERRCQFLNEAVLALELADQVTVVRGRVEDRAVRDAVGSVRWVTARAVAPLGRLVGWCLPLLEVGGQLVAMKGSQAAAEVAEHAALLKRLGVSRTDVVECGVGVVDPPVTVVVLERGASSRKPKGKS